MGQSEVWYMTNLTFMTNMTFSLFCGAKLRADDDKKWPLLNPWISRGRNNKTFNWPCFPVPSFVIQCWYDCFRHDSSRERRRDSSSVV